MSDVLWTRVSYAKEFIIIETPKTLKGAQQIHTAKFKDAMTELRRREADKIQGINSYAADVLRVPWDPGKLTTGSSYTGNLRLWRPAMPVQWWKAPKPPSDKQARINADKILKRDYVPTVWGGWTSRTDVTRDMFGVEYEDVKETGGTDSEEWQDG